MGYHENFEVGDHVIVGDEANIRKCCHGYDRQMFQYAGREAIIVRASKYGYSIDIDGECWSWCDKTLFPVRPMKTPDLEPVDNLFNLFGGAL